MNFLNFEYMLTIARVGTIRGAAEALYISPQALSEHLKKLELEIGTPLFQRTKPLTLTEAGCQFLICAETCLDAKKQLEVELASISVRNDRHISLGVPTGMSPPLLVSFLEFFRHKHPEQSVTVTELPTRTGALLEIPSHIDAVIGEFQGENSKLTYTPVLQSGRFVVAVHRALLAATFAPEGAAEVESAAAAGRPLPLSRFRDCPFVLKRSGSIVREIEDRLFRQSGVTPISNVQTGDMELTVRLVLLGHAAVFLPEPVARANLILPDTLVHNDSIVLCPLQMNGEIWQLSIGCPRYRKSPKGVTLLTEAAALYYNSVLGA
ncbi:MAG: LysR family transcriptional regulator [Oscillospiraceae bacterium]|nr:LysR family transcriptional regulator [Oscillospiraceae bacterium]